MTVTLCGSNIEELERNMHYYIKLYGWGSLSLLERSSHAHEKEREIIASGLYSIYVTNWSPRATAAVSSGLYDTVLLQFVTSPV